MLHRKNKFAPKYYPSYGAKKKKECCCTTIGFIYRDWTVMILCESQSAIQLIIEWHFYFEWMHFVCECVLIFFSFFHFPLYLVIVLISLLMNQLIACPQVAHGILFASALSLSNNHPYRVRRIECRNKQKKRESQ